MFPPEQEQTVPPTHSWEQSEDHFARKPDAEKQLLVNLSAGSQPSQRHSLMDSELSKFEANWLAYIIIGLAALLFATCILAVLLTLDILPAREIPPDHSSTSSPIGVPTLDETKMSSNAIAKPGHATPPARRTIASAANSATPAPADASANTTAFAATSATPAPAGASSNIIASIATSQTPAPASASANSVAPAATSATPAPAGASSNTIASVATSATPAPTRASANTIASAATSATPTPAGASANTIASAATSATPAPAGASANTIASAATSATSVTSFASTTSATTSSTARAPAAVGRHVVVFNRGRLYYRSAYLDEAGGHLYVGARERLFKLQLEDISHALLGELHLPAPQSSVSTCKTLGGGPLGPDVDCANHIRIVEPIGNGSTLYVCGTNARDPTDWQVRATDLSLVPLAEQVAIKDSNVTGKAEGRCSYFVSQDTIALWLDDAPKQNGSCVVGLWALKSGGHAIYRSAVPEPGTNAVLHDYLLTDASNAAVLADPHVVGAFSLGAHVYFIFREEQTERRACGGRVASTISRVCKNDLGGGDRARRQRWTSYMKVRLRCTDFFRSPEESAKANFTYDQIHGSYWVPDLENGVLFGTFVTVTHGSPDSAVCAFRREDIERAFNGTSFIRLASGRNVVGSVVRTNTTTYPGTGSACVPDSRTLSRADTDFLFSNPLLAEPPQLRHDRTFYALRGVAFRLMVAFLFSISWGSWIICYVATDTGLVVKLAQDIVTGGAVPSRARRVDAFNVSIDGIRKMLVSVRHRSLYVFLDSDVRQYRVDDCLASYLNCTSCVADPFCGWNGTRCLPHCEGTSCTTRRAC